LSGTRWPSTLDDVGELTTRPLSQSLDRRPVWVFRGCSWAFRLHSSLRTARAGFSEVMADAIAIAKG